MAKQKIKETTELDKALEELKERAGLVEKPLPTGINEMQESLQRFLHSWDKMNVPAQHHKRVHDVIRNRIVMTLQACFGMRVAAESNKQNLKQKYD